MGSLSEVSETFKFRERYQPVCRRKPADQVDTRSGGASTNSDLLTLNRLNHLRTHPVENCYVSWTIRTITTTGMPMIMMRQPSLVMQPMIVNGSFKSLIIKRSGSVTSPSSWNMI